jgi:hypothetical protein
MAKGGRRKGAGRKPAGKVAMLVRVAPEVRARLERDAKRANRSLSSEVELRLDAIGAAPRADTHTRALCYLIAQAAKIAQTLERTAAPEFSWRDNRFDFEAFKCAVTQILDRLAPAGEVGSSRYPIGQTPEEIGRTAAQLVFALLRSPDTLHAMAEQRGARRGSLLNVYPQAARDLGLSTGDEK